MIYFTFLQVTTTASNFMSNGELIITGLVVIVGIFTVFANYKVSVKMKKFEYFFERKTEAFREVFSQINEFKNYCSGRMAYIQGNEFAPFYTDKVRTLALRQQIAKVVSSQGVFLSTESRRLVNNLLDSLSQLCSLEATFVLKENLDLETEGLYNTPFQAADSILVALHDELLNSIS